MGSRWLGACLTVAVVSSGICASAAPASAAAGAPVSDDFHATSLNPSLWSVEDPVGDGSVSVNGHALVLTVPPGDAHDTWSSGDKDLRVVQPVANADFDVETKFESMGSLEYQDEGILVESSSSTVLRFSVYSTGSAVNVFAAEVVPGVSAAVEILQPVANAQAPFWLRVRRTADTWLLAYSRDGSTWTVAGSFSDTLKVDRIGPYVGSNGPTDTTAPGFTANVDYFFNTASPIVPEDGPLDVPATLANDDFSGGTLNTSTWTFVNPDGASSVTMNGTHAVIDVPAGSSHDPDASPDGAPRLVQPIANSDFSVDAKFDTPLTQQFQEQGIVVEQDTTHWLYAAVRQNWLQTVVTVHSVSDSTVTPITTFEIYNKTSITLRLMRIGTDWTLSFSSDGLHWSAGTTFVSSLAANSVGVFGANVGGASSPAFSSSVDYVVNSFAPPATNDGYPWVSAPASPVINVWYGTHQTFGAHGQPQQWVNVLGDVSDPNGIGSLSYSVNGGPDQPLSIGENEVRLVSPGDFNAEIDDATLETGVNTVHISAVDIFGNASSTDVTVTKVDGGAWPLPYTADWSQASGNVDNLAQIADGQWQVEPDGTIHNRDFGYDRLVALGDSSGWPQIQVTAQVTINGLDPDGSAVGIVAGWHGATADLNGALDIDQPRSGHPFPAAFTYTNGRGQLPKLEIGANTLAQPEATLASDTTGMQLTIGVPYMFKFLVTDNANGGSHVSFKVWRSGTAEPASWLIQTDAELTHGAIALVAHRADVDFGTVTVTPPPPHVPSAPTGAHAALAGSNVSVSWAAAAGNGSPVTGYTVTAAPGGRSMNVAGNQLKASFAGLGPGTYTFKVRATNAVGVGPWSAGSNAITIVGAASRSGYWMLGADGRVYAFGGAANLGSARPTAVAIATRADGSGYWVVDAAGNVTPFGTARGYGGRPALLAGERVSTISATPSGRGYWLFTTRGRAFAYGDAPFLGDMRATVLNGPVVGSAATATGRGYYMVGSDGGIFGFGDAKFHGSMGGKPLNKPVIGIVPTAGNGGYWLVASDGGIFGFGDAGFHGSMGGKPLNKPIVGLVRYGNGYIMVASDGGIFSFSDKPFFGSLGGTALSAPIVGVAAFAP